MKHLANADFWDCYLALPESTKELADKQFELLKRNPLHSSLHFKHVGPYYSVRISKNFRALARVVDVGLTWFWIGPHDEYERLLK